MPSLFVDANIHKCLKVRSLANWRGGGGGVGMDIGIKFLPVSLP